MQARPPTTEGQSLPGGRFGRPPAANFRSMILFIGRPAFLFSFNSGSASYAARWGDVKWPERRLSVYLSRNGGFLSGGVALQRRRFGRLGRTSPSAWRALASSLR